MLANSSLQPQSLASGDGTIARLVGLSYTSVYPGQRCSAAMNLKAAKIAAIVGFSGTILSLEIFNNLQL